MPGLVRAKKVELPGDQLPVRLIRAIAVLRDILQDRLAVVKDIERRRQGRAPLVRRIDPLAVALH